MATKKKSAKARKGTDGSGRESQTPSVLGQRNLVAGAAGLLVLAAGYWLLAQGSITAAPLLLVLGYVVLLPMAILW